MADFNINATSLDMSHNYTSTFVHKTFFSITYVMTCIIICIGLPLTFVAIYALYSLVGKDRVAPIYVINLLISDLIQFFCMIVFVANPPFLMLTYDIYYSSLVASVYFMVCIALERYLGIAWPLWYRFRRTIKISVVVCVLVWVFSLFSIFLFFYVIWYFHVLFFLLPLPALIFFLVGTLKALCASISVPADEKRRIVAMLVLVLVIYLLLFLPRIIMNLKDVYSYDITGFIQSDVFFKLSPLADLVLYVFMRKGAIDKVLASVCCCRMDSKDVTGSTV